MASDIDRHLGARVSQARLQRRLSVDELARSVGLSDETLAEIEAGKTRIRALHLARLAKVLGHPLRWFYEGLPGQSKFEQR